MRKIIPQFSFITVVGLLILSLTACTDGEKQNNNNSDTLIDVTQITDDNLTFYLIPSPKDMFAFTKNTDLRFSDAVLNPKTNADKYLDTKTQEIGFGVYSADLAYAAAFNQSNKAAEYIKVVRNLSDEIGITIFDESLLRRIDNIPESEDSLMRITNDTYHDIVKFLERNERETSLALISAGGWIESLYIVINLTGEYRENDRVIQLIADQKNIFENLVLFLEQNKDNRDIGELLEDIKPIQKVYESLEVVKIEKDDKIANPDNKFIVGGATRITMTPQQFKDLKEAITIVRNKLTLNHV
jgi:hypothetical protein